MRFNRYHEPVYALDDLADLLLSAPAGFFSDPIMESPVIWPDELDLEPLPHLVNTESASVEDYDITNQKTWWMPAEYQQLDIAKLVLDRCSNDAELQRAGHELLMYAERGMLPLLNYMHYLVSTMKTQRIVWGVGRGSSTASFVLYLLEVHRVNSLYYDLDITEFLK